MFNNRFLRFFWVILLLLSAFTLGYTLKPSTLERVRPFAAMGGGRGIAPPLNFGGRR